MGGKRVGERSRMINNNEHMNEQKPPQGLRWGSEIVSPGGVTGLASTLTSLAWATRVTQD